MQIHDLTLTPYVLGWPELAGPVAEVAGVDAIHVADPLAPEQALFARLLNAANALAFGNLGMPLWVQLDCATLPSAFHGFALPRAAIPPERWAALGATYARIHPDLPSGSLEPYTGLVPVSGFCAVRTARPDTIVAFSLFSILRGRRLGVRTKAFGLLAHGPAQQVGVTQYDNAALRVHAAFGPLEILAPRAHGHTHPERSFVYRLRVPAAAVLHERLDDGRMDAATGATGCTYEAIDSTIADRLAARVAAGGRLTVEPPGVVERGGAPHLVLRQERSAAIPSR